MLLSFQTLSWQSNPSTPKHCLSLYIAPGQIYNCRSAPKSIHHAAPTYYALFTVPFHPSYPVCTQHHNPHCT